MLIFKMLCDKIFFSINHQNPKVNKNSAIEMIAVYLFVLNLENPKINRIKFLIKILLYL